MPGTRSGGGAVRGNRAQKKAALEKEALEKMIKEAEYEAEVDPYRGMSNLTTTAVAATAATICSSHDDHHQDVNSSFGKCPWQRCEFGSSKPTSSNGSIEDSVEAKDGQEIVSLVCQSHCPTLIAWTNERLQKRGNSRRKKRKGKNNENGEPINGSSASDIFGYRSVEDPALRCRCDYNPFCLGTLGGAMNRLLLNNPAATTTLLDIKDSDKMQCAESVDDCNDKEITIQSSDGHDKEVVILDGSCSSPPSPGHVEQVKKDRDGNNNSDDSVKKIYESLASERETDEVSVIDVDGSNGSEIKMQKEPERDANTKVHDIEGTAALDPNSFHPESRNSIYSTKTLADLKAVRKFTWVDSENVYTYLKETLGRLASTTSVDDMMNEIRRRHSSLCFVNPLLDDDEGENPKTRMRFSKPPGICNLGGTCYLNAQLQCLAQNQVFLDGIFTWRAGLGEDQDRMTSVLSFLQELLVQMNIGSGCTVNTLEFSNALGLDHYEQQDPNEFSRLLFERMHESFQQSASRAIDSKEGSGHINLANLLPHLFQGVITYETICLTCKAKSRTSEQFMDLNLPIVKSTPKESSGGTPRKAGQQSILEFTTSSRSEDTDVQYCFDSYCRDERFEGDNQYLCNVCGCKRDANRALTFQKLPPVLNVQLCRYVFDRVKLEKVKLADRVGLPLELHVESGNNQENAESLSKQRYVLCAVMRHQGTSAYSGHYVAEAMDWLTGQWFEFNDEKVTLLQTGPSCSYNPSFSSTVENCTKSQENGKRKARSCTQKGSQDAYNLYYVEESFLAQSAWDSLRKRSNLNDKNSDDISLVDRATIDRCESYQDLMQMCLDDKKAANRLKRRHEIIGRDMFSNLLSTKASSEDPSDLVWVDATQLRRALSTEDRLEDELLGRGGKGVFRHSHLLCNHEEPGLHPRVARRGKLLPRRIYEVLISALRDERNLLCGVASPVNDLNDCVITPDKNLFCQKCADDYCVELKAKLDLIKKLRDLNELLDPKRDSLLSQDRRLDSDEEKEQTDCEYIVSRKFVTHFRKIMTRISKAAATSESVTMTKAAPGAILNGVECIAEGLDSLDMFDFKSNLNESIETRQDDNEDKLDFRVNGNITCPHGRCKRINKRNGLSVSWKTWGLLKAVFPNAIEHKKKSGELTGCQLCEAEGNLADRLSNRLSELSRSYSGGARRCKTLTNEDVIKSESSGIGNKFKILHSNDFKAFNRLISSLKGKDSRCRTANELKAQVEDLLTAEVAFHAHPLFAKGQATSPPPSIRFLTNTIRPVLCREHKMPIQSSLFQDTVNSDSTGTQTPLSLHKRVCLIHQKAYDEFLTHLTAVASLAFPDKNQNHDRTLEETLEDELSSAAMLWKDWSISDFHPTFERVSMGSSSKNLPRFSISSHDQSMVFNLSSPLCTDEACARDFAAWQKEVDSAMETNHSSSKVISEANRTTVPGSADIPILVESDAEEEKYSRISLRVFELDEEADFQTSLPSLLRCSGLPSFDSPGSVVRRSSRKRKARYPVGAVKEEENVQICIHNNIAALRLMLLERCSLGTPFELNSTLKLVISTRSSNEEPIIVDGDPTTVDVDGDVGDDVLLLNKQPVVVDLSFDRNEQTMLSVCEVALGTKLGKEFVPAEEVFLVRQMKKDDTSQGIPSDQLMEHLISLADTTTEVQTNGKNNNRKKGKSVKEKGFTGTLLSSASTKVIENVNSSTGDAASNAKEEEPRKNKTVDSIATNSVGNGLGLSDYDSPPSSGQKSPDSLLMVESTTFRPNVSENDYDANSRKRVHATTTCTAKKRKGSHPNSVESRESNDKLFEGEPLKKSIRVNSPQPSPLQGENQTCGDSGVAARRKSLRSVDQELVSKLKGLLAENDCVDCIFGHNECHRAAEWTVKMNEGVNVEDLVDPALAKYFELLAR